MTKHEAIEAPTEKPRGLDLMRAPFEPHQISKLPKPTKKQTEAVRADFKNGIRCTICGGWHHKDVVHLDYVGHAALTDRLLECDPTWNWEPVAFDEKGQPLLDQCGGMWIRLTVCGQTRLGYGHSDGKRGGDAIKEVIGDALRNAAMRFGAALDLWHKGELHRSDEPDEGNAAATANQQVQTVSAGQFTKLRDLAQEAGVTEEEVCAKVGAPSLEQFPANRFDAVAKGLQSKIDAANPSPAEQITDDEVPY
ncbi:hypothetical protein [Phaeobacter piscinae]|uniref:hypothetical protein n=1 Tax=Phaeobacter piscinae TaxID=1580596 RepID=UPI000C9C27F4|nr:hypothetical protein [Phaeobacter piscinae]AUQ74788.1 ERF superfamily protein [Phaeobacter piscinae]